MMADTGTGRILATQSHIPIHGYDRAGGTFHEDVGHLDRERTVSVGQGVRKKGLGKQESSSSTADYSREVGFLPAIGQLPLAAFLGTDPTDELITSRFPMIRINRRSMAT